MRAKLKNSIERIPTRKVRIKPQLLIIFTLFLLNFCTAVSDLSADSKPMLWDALSSGSHVALLRHALAPGTGDPPEFQLGKCKTQRNLSDEGRDQARKIGDLFRENGINEAAIFSSQWCRCLETAKLLNLGSVEELVILNSFFQQYEHRDLQTRMLLEWLQDQDFELPIVLVTHQVNITALTGIYPDSGELVIIHRSNTGNVKVIGTIETR